MDNPYTITVVILLTYTLQSHWESYFLAHNLTHKKTLDKVRRHDTIIDITFAFFSGKHRSMFDNTRREGEYIVSPQYYPPQDP